MSGAARAFAVGSVLVPLALAVLPTGASASGHHGAGYEEDHVCLMQKTLSLEHPADRQHLGHQGIQEPVHLSQPDQGRPSSPESASSAVLLEADREWHKLYESLAGVEPPRKLLGIHRTLRIFAAVSLGTVLLSTWLCCMGTRVAHWIVFAFPLAPQKTRDEKGGSVKACGFPPPNEDDFKPSDAAFVRSTTFSASARSLSALLSREVAELNLGTKTGDMALRIVLQPAMPTGFVATVELVNAQDQGMPVASCRSEDGSTQFKISDTAGTFTGTLGPLEGRGQPAGVCRFRLVREGRGDTVLTIEGPADGRPTPGSSPLIAKTAYDGVLGSLILDEDDVEVTLMHSAMDSVVLVALMGLCLLKQ